MEMMLLLFILPFLGAVVLQFIDNRSTASTVALLFSLATLVVTGIMLSGFNPEGGFQYAIDYWWVPALGIGFTTGVDGVSMLMLLLTSGLVPLIIYSAIEREFKNFKMFYGLILLMQMALYGVFTALDGFLFYVFWELALIPIWFICLLWGGAERIRITLKFFIYTLAGSLIMLVGLIWLYLQTPAPHAFSYEALSNVALDPENQSYLFWAFFAAFAIKIPVFPFHTWQPDTYVDAPVQGTMLLSGIMLKMGLFGIIRWMIPVIPDGVQQWGTVAAVLASIGVVYGSLMAMAQKDFKRLIAYSSMAHVGLIAAGLMTLNPQAMAGGVFQMLSHGLVAVGMFFICEILMRRFNLDEMAEMGGVAGKSQSFSILFMVVLLGSVGLPLTSGFIGEFLLLSGIYAMNPWLAAFAGLSVILGATYMLRAYKQIMLGNESVVTAQFTPLTIHEKTLLVIVALLIVVLGIFPQSLLDLAGPSLENIIRAGV